MRTLNDHLAHYAVCHRDRRNIATHFAGIPMIAVAVAVLLSRPSLVLAGIPLTPAALVVVCVTVFYLRLDVRLAVIMAALMSVALAFGAWAASQPTSTWLAIGASGVVTGFTLQFIGHIWEGRKPAFLDDLTGLLIGPLFLVAEVMFALGLRRDLQLHIESTVGPTCRGERDRPCLPPAELPSRLNLSAGNAATQKAAGAPQEWSDSHSERACACVHRERP